MSLDLFDELRNHHLEHPTEYEHSLVKPLLTGTMGVARCGYKGQVTSAKAHFPKCPTCIMKGGWQ